ncbi:MAG: choice-of-anchor L domain-containing protein [Flavobacteriales bacterium]|nr:choice-of-anchor L domain-containing protein [Flavobacteriales bacterium]MCB9364526.1 choice-of-anchor L domain-containing protein [Flavobacteriales bacterium]
MIKRLLISLSFIFCFYLLKAQLTVSTGVMTPTQYVQNVLIGSGVTVSNINYYGHPRQIGTFNGATSTIGLNSGLVLSSGEVMSNQPGGMPDTDIEGTYGVNPNWGGGDPDLLTVAKSVTTNPDAAFISSTHDMAMIEFDFVPTGDTVKFNFVFASEEYTAFINSSYNDVFGFFISGPGIVGPYAAPGGFPNGAKNIALVPGTTLPITISTIYSDPFQTPPNFNAQYYIDNSNNNTHELNGFTTVLTAVAAVQCGELYHMRLAVADAQDGILDTDVFLEAGSFSSNTITLNSNINVSSGDSILYEGCGTAYIDFERNDDADTAVFYYNFYGDFSPSDYTISADSIVFLPGESVATLEFNALEDNTVEGLEQVNIEMIQIICSVADTSILTFYISDYYLYSSVSPDTNLKCSSDIVPVWVVPHPNVDVLWDTGETTDTIWVNPQTTTAYHVSVSDTCGNVVNDSVEVFVPDFTPLAVNISPSDTTICTGLSVDLDAEISGGIPPYVYSWDHGLGSTLPVQVTPGVTTNYVLTVQDNCGEETDDTAKVTVSVSGINVNLLDDAINCIGDVVEIDATTNFNIGFLTYDWSNGASTPSIQVSPTVTTDYWVSISDACITITDTMTVSVPVFDPFIVTITNDTIICRDGEITIGVEAEGGSENYFYDWKGLGITDSISVQVGELSTYYVTVTDDCGSSKNLNVTIDIKYPTALFDYEFMTDYTVEFYDSSFANITDYLWTFDYGDNSTTQHPIYTYLEKGEHVVSLMVTDFEGCTDIVVDTIRPDIYVYYPNTFTPNSDGKNDVFLVKGMGVEEFELIIYNRWGEKIFHTDNMEIGWDGTYKGELVPVGTYVLALKTKNYDGKVTNQRGVINVLR